jgi:hypothetical protein
VTKFVVFLLVATAAVASLVGARAAGTVADAPVTACVRKGVASVVAAGKACPRGAARLTWNIPGARGSAGLQGAAGAAGAAGPAGAAGAPGAAGVFGDRLDRANGLACHLSDGGAAGTLAVRHNAATGLEEFVCH